MLQMYSVQLKTFIILCMSFRKGGTRQLGGYRVRFGCGGISCPFRVHFGCVCISCPFRMRVHFVSISDVCPFRMRVNFVSISDACPFRVIGCCTCPQDAYMTWV